MGSTTGWWPLPWLLISSWALFKVQQKHVQLNVSVNDHGIISSGTSCQHALTFFDIIHHDTLDLDWCKQIIPASKIHFFGWIFHTFQDGIQRTNAALLMSGSWSAGKGDSGKPGVSWSHPPLAWGQKTCHAHRQDCQIMLNSYPNIYIYIYNYIHMSYVLLKFFVKVTSIMFVTGPVTTGSPLLSMYKHTVETKICNMLTWDSSIHVPWHL